MMRKSDSYEAAAVTDYGDLSDLTAGQSNMGTEDGAHKAPDMVTSPH